MGIGSHAADVTTIRPYGLPLLRKCGAWDQNARNKQLPDWRQHKHV